MLILLCGKFSAFFSGYLKMSAQVAITDVKKSPLLDIKYPPKVVSCYGPKNTLRSKTVATSFSKSSFFIEVKGLSPNCLLGPYIELCVPMTIRFMKQTGQCCVINSYADCMPLSNPCADGVPTDNRGGQNALPAVRTIDSVSTRPNGVVRALRSCVVSINGSSFSSPQTASWIDIVERLYCDNRVEPATGWSNAQPPYTNYGHPAKGMTERSRMQRCVNTVGVKQISSAHYALHLLDDVVYRIIHRTRLHVGPWFFSQFPGASALDGNQSGALPYIQNLTVEGQWVDNPLVHLFSCVGSDMSNSQAQSSPATVPLNDNGQNAIDFNAMWTGVTTGSTDIVAVPAANRAGRHVNLEAPYLEYQWLEPDLSLQNFAPSYTVAGKRLVCYDQMAQTTAANQWVDFAFQYVKLDSISQLYAVYVTDSGVDVGTAFGARVAKHSNAGAANLIGHLGAQYSNIFSPINWKSVKISLSTKSSILGNLSGEDLGITEKSQYRKYIKYSGGMNPMDFLSWRRHSQCILFTAEELGLAFGGSYQQVTLNISFQAGRQCSQTALTPRDYWKDDNSPVPFLGGIGSKAKGFDKLANLTAHLVMFEPTQITLSEGACSTMSIMYTNDQAKAAYDRQSSSQVSGPSAEQMSFQSQ